MILLSGFLDVLFRAWAFIGMALSIGGIVFEYFVLRPALRRAASQRPALVRELVSVGAAVESQYVHMSSSETRSSLPGGWDDEAQTSALRRCASLISIGAFLVGLCELGALIITPWTFADDMGHWPMKAFLSTGFARAAIAHTAIAFVMGFVALWFRSRPKSSGVLAITTVFGLLLLVTGGLLTHGASRLVNPILLMTMTVVHQLPAVTWIGGTLHLVAQWRRRGRTADRDVLWPLMLARFSPLAMACVALLVMAGLYLTYQYVRDLGGLLGTAYGTMLLTKVALMFSALFLGFGNIKAIREWRIWGRTTAFLRRAPVLVETEAAIGICIMMAAAAFTSQPPAIDLQPERASPREVAHVFAPKVPRLISAPWKEMIATSTLTLDPYSLPTHIEKIQSDFNHNVSGVFVLMAAIGALVYRINGARWARHWPLAFVPLAIFVLLVGEPTVWPLGPESALATLMAPEVLMHRLAVVMLVGLIIFEWKVAAGRWAGSRAQYVFPIICFIGGALLLGHSHYIFVTKWTFLIEVSHNALGILAVLAGVTRWLEIRLPDREGTCPGKLWPVCLALVGLVLLFYRES